MGRKRSNSFVVDEESDQERPTTVTKKVKKSSSKEDAGVDSEGNRFWELSNKRRVTIQKFKSNMFVNLREYYEDNKSGEMKPGKKGIMLTIEQYKSLIDLVPEINAELLKVGVDVHGKEVPSDSSDEEAAAETSKKTKAKVKSKKANYAATSDEE